MSDVIRPRRIEFRDVPSAGCQIHADLKFKANCIEFTLKEGWQPVVQSRTEAPRRQTEWPDECIAYDTWLQFPPDEYEAMKTQLFKEMVDLWNEKYAVLDEDGNDIKRLDIKE